MGRKRRSYGDDEADDAIQPVSAELWPLWQRIFNIHCQSGLEPEDAYGSTNKPYAFARADCKCRQ